MTAFKKLLTLGLLNAALVFGQFTTLPDTGGAPGSGSIAATTNVIKGDGAGAGVAATAGTDFSKPNTSETTSGNRTFTGAIDASGATSTAPLKSGTSTPGTCSPPQMFFETDATAGANIWLCTSANNWTQITGDSSGSLPTDLNITRTSSTLLTMASGTFLYNNTPFSFAGGTVAMGSFVGSTTLKFCLASDGTIKAAHDASEGLFTVSGLDEVGGVSECPSATEVVWQWVVTSGTFDATGSDYRYKRRVRDEVAASGSGARTIEYQAAQCFSGAAATPLSIPASGAPTAACVTGSNALGGVLQFLDTETESAQNRFVATGTTISADIFWRANVANATLNAVWQLQTACVAADEDGDPAWNTAQTVTSAAHGTAYRWRKATISSVTVTGCSANEVLRWKLYRDPSHASDTLAATAELVSLVFTVQ